MVAKIEGIALLSMYDDEEDEDEELPIHILGTGDKDEIDDGSKHNATPPHPDPTSHPSIINSLTPHLSDEEFDHETLGSPNPQPQLTIPFTLPSPPPHRPPASMETLVPPRAKRGALAIVDYDHDEGAMSPEAEEGEILSTSYAVIKSELHGLDEHFEEKTPLGTVHILASSNQPEPPQPSDFPEHSESQIHTAMDFTETDAEVAQSEGAAVVFVEIEEDDCLSNFLPPLLTIKCPEDLQEKINKFLAYKKVGKSFNTDLRNRKDYRNPDFLQHAVTYQDIDQIGTCFNKDVFDPHGYVKSDFYDEIEADMKHEMERKKSQKVDFVSGVTQSATVPPALRITTHISVAAAKGLQSVSAAVDATASRQNKKTKWDKVDGDVKNPLQSGGQDHLSTVGAQAVHLSSANAGAGYSAFAQQKRREAEEKRSK